MLRPQARRAKLPVLNASHEALTSCSAAPVHHPIASPGPGRHAPASAELKQTGVGRFDSDHE